MRKKQKGKEIKEGNEKDREAKQIGLTGGSYSMCFTDQESACLFHPVRPVPNCSSHA